MNAPSISGSDGTTFTTPPSFTITGDATGDTANWVLDSPTVAGFANNGGATNLIDFTLSTGTLSVAQNGLYKLHATQSSSITSEVSSETVRTFVLSSPVPGAPTATGPGISNNNPPPTFSWTSPAGAATFDWEILLNGVVQQSANIPGTTVSPNLPEGNYAFQVRAVDSVGNRGSFSNGVPFTIDLTPPLAPTLLATAQNPTNNARPAFTWGGLEPLGTVQATIDARPPVLASSPFTTPLPALSGGPLPTGALHTIAIRQIDAAGNVGPPATLVFTVDTTPPTVVTTSGSNATFPAPGDNLTTAFGPLANIQMFFSEPVQGTTVQVCTFPCPNGQVGGTPFVSGAAASFDPTAPLTANTRYEIQLLGFRDAVGNSLTGVGKTLRWTFTTSSDATPPGPVTNLLAVAGIGQVALSWVRPTDLDLAKIVVLRGTTPPSSAADPSATRFSRPATDVAFTDVGLTPGVTYYYAVYAEDAVGNPSPLAVATAVPLGFVLGKPLPPKTFLARFMRPKKGKVIGTLRPLLRWRPYKGAVLYNVKVFDLDLARVATGLVRERGKVVSWFPRIPRYKVPKGRLKPGHRFAWVVFAWRGRKKGFVKVPMTSWFDTSPGAKP